MRPPRLDEAAVAAALAGVYAPEPTDPVWIERAWTEPTFDLERDARTDGGAYASVWKEGEKAWIHVQGSPTAELLEWAESRAREKDARRAFIFAWSTDEPLNGAAERAGFRLVRHSYRMQISLDGTADPPSWPQGLTVRTHRPGDERTFYDVHQETFEDSWEHERFPYEEWVHWFLAPPLFDPGLWFLAEGGGEAAGIAICHGRPEAPDLGWVGILGVRRPWRRRGLGRALLLHAFEEFRGRGLARAGLGVDAESLTGAHRLYENVGMHVAARSNFYEKPLT
jgi:GNAT superfamily N-acetyltransferase